MSYPEPDQPQQDHRDSPGQDVPPVEEFAEGGKVVYPQQPQGSGGSEQSGIPPVPEYPPQNVPQAYAQPQEQVFHQEQNPQYHSHETTQPGQPGQGLAPDHPQQAVPQPQQYLPPPPPEQPAYNTPFAQSEMAMPRASASGGKAALWAAVGGVGVILVLVIGFFVYRSIQDPFRTLDTFPTEKYLDNYESVVGSRFRAKLTVAAELGGTFDSGRLLSFREESSQRSLAVLVSPELGQIGFSKGQSYLAEIEVKEGGLIYAHAFKKN